ncbi:MAG: hypothetical protein V5A62_09390 [Haloarculaceae archaeon]
MGIVEGRSVKGLLAAVRQGRPVGKLLEGPRRGIWAVAFLFFCVGDVVTTHVGLSIHGVIEAGPVVAPVLREYGLAAMFGLKGATLALFYGLYRVVPDPQSIGVPFGLALVGVFVTGWNLVVICLGAL